MIFPNLLSSKHTYVAKPMQQVPKVRGVDMTPEQIDAIKRIVYSEVSNRPEDKKDLETRVLLNTAINRVGAYNKRGSKKTLKDVFEMPNQYQGFGTRLYKEYDKPRNVLEQQRKAQIDAIVNRLVAEGEQFKDNTEGAYYYKHVGDKIYYDANRPLFQ